MLCCSTYTRTYNLRFLRLSNNVNISCKTIKYVHLYMSVCGRLAECLIPLHCLWLLTWIRLEFESIHSHSSQTQVRVHSYHWGENNSVWVSNMTPLTRDTYEQNNLPYRWAHHHIRNCCLVYWRGVSEVTPQLGAIGLEV